MTNRYIGDKEANEQGHELADWNACFPSEEKDKALMGMLKQWIATREAIIKEGERLADEYDAESRTYYGDSRKYELIAICEYQASAIRDFLGFIRNPNGDEK